MACYRSITANCRVINNTARIGRPRPVAALSDHEGRAMTRNQLRILCGPANAALPIAILLATPLAAQTTPGQQPPAKLEEVVVTGSLVRREDLITPSPVTVISAEDIQN